MQSPAKLLILDLDETLVHSMPTPLAHAADLQFDKYHVYLRPGVQPFLHFCRQHYRVAVWTSSSEDYAQAIVSHLFGADYPLEFVWARQRCTPRFDSEAMDYEWGKNLQKVKRRGYALEHVLMVDDTPRKLAQHYGNLVRVQMFEGDPNDTELQRLMAYLLYLKPVPNVRQVEKRGWQQAFK